MGAIEQHWEDSVKGIISIKLLHVFYVCILPFFASEVLGLIGGSQESDERNPREVSPRESRNLDSEMSRPILSLIHI